MGLRVAIFRENGLRKIPSSPLEIGKQKNFEHFPKIQPVCGNMEEYERNMQEIGDECASSCIKLSPCINALNRSIHISPYISTLGFGIIPSFTFCIGYETQKSECESSYIAFSLYKCSKHPYRLWPFIQPRGLGKTSSFPAEKYREKSGDKT